MNERGDKAPAPPSEGRFGRRPGEDALVRLRRAHGQLGGVIHMMDAQRDSGEVLTQLAAVLHALHRAAYQLVAVELEHCSDAARGGCTARQAELEKLFVALG